MATSELSEQRSEQRWGTSEDEQRLLDFVAELILDVGRSNTRLSEFKIALWLARATVGGRN